MQMSCLTPANFRADSTDAIDDNMTDRQEEKDKEHQARTAQGTMIQYNEILIELHGPEDEEHILEQRTHRWPTARF